MGTKTTYIFLTINHNITGGKVHIQFWYVPKLIPPSFEEHSNGPLGNHKSLTQSLEVLLSVPKVDRCWRSGQWESQWHIQWWTQGQVRPFRPSPGYLLEPRGKKQSGCVTHQSNRNLQACGYGCFYGESLPWNMPMQRESNAKTERERGQGFLTLFETGSNQTWNDTYPCIFFNYMN